MLFSTHTEIVSHIRTQSDVTFGMSVEGLRFWQVWFQGPTPLPGLESDVWGFNLVGRHGDQFADPKPVWCGVLGSFGLFHFFRSGIRERGLVSQIRTYSDAYGLGSRLRGSGFDN